MNHIETNLNINLEHLLSYIALITHKYRWFSAIPDISHGRIEASGVRTQASTVRSSINSWYYTLCQFHDLYKLGNVRRYGRREIYIAVTFSRLLPTLAVWAAHVRPNPEFSDSKCVCQRPYFLAREHQLNVFPSIR